MSNIARLADKCTELGVRVLLFSTTYVPNIYCSVKRPAVRRQGREADHSRPSNKGVNKAWSYLHSFMKYTATTLSAPSPEKKLDFLIITLQTRLKKKRLA
jgi:hypothetical protein